MKSVPQIYSLHCPETGHLRYLGKSVDVKARYLAHISPSGLGKDYRSNWIRSLLAKGLKPILLIVDTVTEETWEAAERHYIKRAKELGFSLVNGTDGGEAGRKNQTLETRKKISDSRKGKKRKLFSNEWRNNLSKALTGRETSEATRKKLSIANLGKRIPVETREKLRVANLGKKASAETRAKQSAAGKRKVFSAQHRARLSEANTRRHARARAEKGNRS